MLPRRLRSKAWSWLLAGGGGGVRCGDNARSVRASFTCRIANTRHTRTQATAAWPSIPRLDNYHQTEPYMTLFALLCLAPSCGSLPSDHQSLGLSCLLFSLLRGCPVAAVPRRRQRPQRFGPLRDLRAKQNGAGGPSSASKDTAPPLAA